MAAVSATGRTVILPGRGLAGRDPPPAGL